jgi:hypothetical protein
MNYIMVRPSNSRLRRATYVQDGAGPMKAGLAPTVGKNHHFFRIKRTVGAPKCCVPLSEPEIESVTFDGSDNLYVILKFKNSLTIDSDNKNKISDSNFMNLFTLQHEDTFNNNNNSFVGLTNITIDKAFIHNTDVNPSNVTDNTASGVGKYIILRINETVYDNVHRVMILEKYFVTYALPSAAKKEYLIRRSGAGRGSLSNGFNSSSTVPNDLDIDITVDSVKQITVNFNNIMERKDLANNKAALSTVFSLKKAGDDILVTVTDTTMAFDANNKKLEIKYPYSAKLTTNDTIVLKHTPILTPEGTAKTNFIMTNDTDNVKNSRLHEFEKTLTVPADTVAPVLATTGTVTANTNTKTIDIAFDQNIADKAAIPATDQTNGDDTVAGFTVTNIANTEMKIMSVGVNNNKIRITTKLDTTASTYTITYTPPTEVNNRFNAANESDGASRDHIADFATSVTTS